ncbi:TIGR01459 family HAD-type hydrolase [Rickettsiales endosymbiont of Peranema trichophorum]|uniref:TIGR01459 family HAD-type hydrolase n=1 Tax=Rickettsiales endosymbiont of Peranema trichophorum TaxID=2486577 RepID=UPI0010237F5B|nr:TIGR01459 family HAD-type hydrolase [Rickettsiales endosymbiont of Peranema trichophorum]RZI45154.1 TIGR01459 family HAD-type hydrolase [Rickettsiales endosymbiont of Peranema trichophorum]
MQHIKDIAAIIDKYELFVVDINGVMHDGLDFYPHALNFLSLLLERNKQVLFLSNAPRPSGIFVTKLASIGYNSPVIRVVTSGDFFVYKLTEMLTKTKKKLPCHVVCQERNEDLPLEALVDATTLEEAEYLILLGFTSEGEAKDRYDQILHKALDKNLTALCPNPDAIAVLGTGFCYPAGLIARRYEAMGGTVIYYGKPHVEIYRFGLQHYLPAISNNAIIAIGDNMRTDIVGAHNIKVDSLLVMYGVHANDSITEISQYDILPTYVLS